MEQEGSCGNVHEFMVDRFAPAVLDPGTFKAEPNENFFLRLPLGNDILEDVLIGVLFLCRFSHCGYHPSFTLSRSYSRSIFFILHKTGIAYLGVSQCLILGR